MRSGVLDPVTYNNTGSCYITKVIIFYEIDRKDDFVCFEN